jgi:hypothetical protein
MTICTVWISLSPAFAVAIEPRLPQSAFLNHHDFHEIVIVEHGTGFTFSTASPIPSAAARSALFAITIAISTSTRTIYA